jgi:hypothetical protein
MLPHPSREESRQDAHVQDVAAAVHEDDRKEAAEAPIVIRRCFDSTMSFSIEFRWQLARASALKARLTGDSASRYGLRRPHAQGAVAKW